MAEGLREISGMVYGGSVGLTDSYDLSVLPTISRVRRKKTTRKVSKSRKKVSKTRRSSKRKPKKTKRVSRSKIKYTKNGQPYKILANGRARFIKGKRLKKRR